LLGTASETHLNAHYSFLIQPYAIITPVVAPPPLTYYFPQPQQLLSWPAGNTTFVRLYQPPLSQYFHQGYHPNTLNQEQPAAMSSAYTPRISECTSDSPLPLPIQDVLTSTSNNTESEMSREKSFKQRNAKARYRSFILRSKIQELKQQKVTRTLSQEEQKFLDKFEKKRHRKNNRSKKRNQERNERIDEIVSKPINLRTGEEIEFLLAHQEAKKRKYENDRMRRILRQHNSFKIQSDQN